MLTVKKRKHYRNFRKGKSHFLEMTSITVNSLGYIFEFLKEFLKESFAYAPLLHIHRFELDASPVFSDNTSRLFNHHSLHTVL